MLLFLFLLCELLYKLIMHLRLPTLPTLTHTHSIVALFGLVCYFAPLNTITTTAIHYIIYLLSAVLPVHSLSLSLSLLILLTDSFMQQYYDDML